MRGGSAVLLCALLGAAAGTPAAAQSPSLTVTLQSEVPRVQSVDVLADGRFVGLMRSGFPLRLHYRLELWRERTNWFDQFQREASWDAVARHDPLSDDFVLIRTGGTVSRYATPEELATEYVRRDQANIQFFLDFERTYEPRPFQRTAAQQGFGLG